MYLLEWLKLGTLTTPSDDDPCGFGAHRTHMYHKWEHNMVQPLWKTV